MSIDFQVLGEPGRDNTLLVRIDSGQAVERLLFDCGEGCLQGFSLSEVRSVDHLFFSHFHMDHVGGFDSYFRANYDRATKPNHVWGPPGSAEVMQHRFRGFLWNLHHGREGTWLVHDVAETRVITNRFELADAFAIAHEEGEAERPRPLCEGVGFTVEAVTMDHRTPCLAYVVRERPRWNVDTARLAALGLQPGPWLKRVTEPGEGTVLVEGAERDLAELRKELLVETPGDSIAYLTDFLLDTTAIERLMPLLQGCGTIVCEAQYRDGDHALAAQNYHMTSKQASGLAARVSAGCLVLFHVSDRYRPPEWCELLAEARAVFPNAGFPATWSV